MRDRILHFDDRGRALGELPIEGEGMYACAVGLKMALMAPRQRGLHRIRVVLATPWAQCFVLPWRSLARHQEWAAYGRSVAGGQGGAAWLDGWRLSVEDAGWGRTRFVEAAPEPICQAITVSCRKRGLWLGGIQSLFVAAVNAQARRIAAQDAACVVVDGDVLHISFRHHAAWSGFISLPGTVASLADALRDAAMLCALSPPDTTYVIGPPDTRYASSQPVEQWLPLPWPIEAAPA
jgi:hypothetical protein